MPALVGIANAVGVIAGIVAARFSVGLGYESFLYGARLFWHSYDLFYSMMSTTASVVFMIIAVLVSDAIFPPLFLN